MKRTISTLGRASKKTLRDYFNTTYGYDAKTINQISKYFGASNDETWEHLLDEYNLEVLKQKQQRKKEKRDNDKKQKKLEMFQTSLEQNKKYFEKKENIKSNKKASIIGKFFQNYKKPINIEKRMKYKNGDQVEWIKQYVDVYKVVSSEPVSIGSDDFKEFFNSKVLSLLGSIYRRYKGGVVQLDFLGRWKSQNEEGNIDFSFIVADANLNLLLTKDKVSIEAVALTPRNYRNIIELMYEALQPPDSGSWFELKEVDIKFIKPLVAGCYTCKGHGKNFKLNNLTLHNPYSTNNNCLFKCIEEHLDFKPTKTKCNEIREEFNIPENEMITFEDAYKIVKKYCNNKTVSIVNNDLDMLYGDDEGEIKLFYLNNHFMTLVGETHKCKKCGCEESEVVDLGAGVADEANIYLFKCKT